MLRIALLSGFLACGVLRAEPPVPPAGETILMEAYDEGRPIPELPPRSKPELRWLRSALKAAPGQPPASPFPTGSPEDREAKALLAWTHQGGDPSGLSLRLTGSQALLWRWASARTRAGKCPAPGRQAWEDRLLRPDIHPLFREFALRHALCHALAEADEGRFGVLKDRWEGESPALFPGFQRAFALLGRPLPRLRLWSLPDLEPFEESLSARGFRRLRIEPAEGTAPLAAPPEGMARILPTREGYLAADAASLEGVSLDEAQALARRTPSGTRGLFLAPSRASLEAYGLTFFPALLELDAQGQVLNIRLGDAALK